VVGGGLDAQEAIVIASMDKRTTDHTHRNCATRVLYWSDRRYRVEDPEGHQWWFMQRGATRGKPA
jgi:hypothetical protein